MSWLRRLLGRGSTSGGSGHERERLASLLATEIRLYNAGDVELAAAEGRVAGRLSREMGRAFQTYLESVGRSEESEAIFRRVLAQLFDGDEKLVRDALQAASEQPLEPS